MATPKTLAGALRQMPSRAAELIACRALDGLSRDQGAARYGITPGQFDVLLVRAALELEAALGGAPSPPPLPIAELTAQAQQLREALEAQRSTVLAAPLLELGLAQAEVRTLLRQAELDAARSPARRRETWLRRVGIVVVIALTLFFYAQQRDREQRPRLEPRDPATTQPR